MTTTLTFAVHRREPVLVGPSTPTPRETKRLSDIDDVLRSHVPFVFFYRGAGERHAEEDHRDPAGVIRRALGKALVPYYPIAGRLREVEARKPVVDCTGEGVLFVEADADVRLDELEAAGLKAPFPCMDQLLFDAEGSNGVLNCPLMLIQVTRLLCGGFVFALRLNHTICDAIGLAQFMFAVAEHARGLPRRAMKVDPTWCRELLEARSPPKPTTFPHREFGIVPQSPPPCDMVMRTFTFGRKDIAAIKNNELPLKLRDTVTSFEALTAVLWRARTAALELPPDEEVQLAIIVNVRNLPELALPAGYYGNACVSSTVLTTAGVLLAGSLADAVQLVRKAKATVTAGYVRSTLDQLVLHGRACVVLANLFVVSDNRHAGFRRVDLGWGEPVYGGPASTECWGSFLIAVKDGVDENTIAVPIVLPRPAMDRFASEVKGVLKS